MPSAAEESRGAAPSALRERDPLSPQHAVPHTERPAGKAAPRGPRCQGETFPGRAIAIHRPQDRSETPCRPPGTARNPGEGSCGPLPAEKPPPEREQRQDKMAPRFKRCALRAGGGAAGGRCPGGVHCACARSCKMADSAELKVKRSFNSLRDAPRCRARGRRGCACLLAWGEPSCCWRCAAPPGCASPGWRRRRPAGSGG